MNSIVKFFKKLFNLLFRKKQKTSTSSKQETKSPQEQIKTYRKKNLMTPTELKFFYAIKQSLPAQYILQAQINLASIIERTDEHKYQNELYRNIDFAIFNNKYEPILLIEINDKTHNEKARIARDYKVKDICQAANLPLITFWTDYGVNQEYIQKRISEYCN